MKYAEKCSAIAEEYAEYWNAYRAKMENYERDSAKAYLDAVAELVELEDTFA
jgi:hypothetical protein